MHLKNGYELDIYKLGSQLVQPYSLRKTNLHYLRVPLFALLRPVKNHHDSKNSLLDLSSFAWRGGGSLVQPICLWLRLSIQSYNHVTAYVFFPNGTHLLKLQKARVLVISPIFLGEFSASIWGRWTHFDVQIVSNGLVQPPTRKGHLHKPGTLNNHSSMDVDCDFFLM